MNKTLVTAIGIYLAVMSVGALAITLTLKSGPYTPALSVIVVGISSLSTVAGIWLSLHYYMTRKR